MRPTRLPLFLLLIVLCAVTAGWWWLGRPVPIETGLAPGGKLACVSYSPFRGAQSPLDPSVRAEPWQIEEDLSRLSAVTSCIRTYSIQHGLDAIPEIAARHGLKVLQGLWLSSRRDQNRTEIDRTIALVKAHPRTVIGVVVGNEVLLRGELSAGDLGAILREVKAAVPVPVTYADVWEFWLRNPALADAADFITVHILPYWEDDPIPADQAGAHVESIVHRVKQAFPGRDILVGEVGWPSAGRMREGALPSLSNEALVVQDVLDRAQRGGFRVNVIEAFDQPWKRALEGTVGGHWGILTDAGREPKFLVGEPVSDHPDWLRNAGLGAVLALAVFAAAFVAGAGRGRDKIPQGAWIAVALTAAAGGLLAGWALEKILVESLGWGGLFRGVLLGVVTVAAPVAGAALLARGERLPGFSEILGAAGERPASPVTAAAGWLLVLTAVLAVQTALGLVFDPRYRDFPFASLTAATLPFLSIAWRVRGEGVRGAAEKGIAATLLLSAGFVVLNETVANWQAVWLALAFAALAVTLLRVRVVRD